MNETKPEMIKDTTAIDIDPLDNVVDEEQQEESYEPIYHVIESANKYAFTNGRKINKVRLVVKRMEVNEKPFMTFQVHIMNQAGTAPVEVMKAGKNTYAYINEVVQAEPIFKAVLKKCKRNSGKYLTKKEAKSLDQYLVKHGQKQK